ncbi:macrophage mannose receptor 1-like [Limanda limanda]|uniref:macrophage mannose receptor 1-like n=1 Tax=Limanda limanda TaxID=27771 RepID=UPI0029C88E58|nr:macrophage mannose receptor 1-like [Limanda limanda]
MEVKGNTDGDFNIEFEMPIYQEDLHDEKEYPPHLNSNKKRQQVSMLDMAPGRHDRQAVLSLAILAAVLLIVDISLGVYYSKLTDTHLTTDDVERIENELNKLQDTYKTAIKTMADARHQLDKEMSRQTPTNWELEHQQKIKSGYEEEIEQMTVAIASMKSQIPVLRDGCRYCPMGWVFVNSACYYFSYSNRDGARSWQKAREFCQNDGGDLVIIDSKDKENSTVNALRNPYKGSRSSDAFWIGLRLIHEEKTWKWWDGTSMAEGYWDDLEPIYSGGEICATVNPRQNFFKAWSTTGCGSGRKWICEKAPTAVNCSKAKDLQAPNSAAMPFIVELNYLRSNHSEMIRAKLESQAALVRERANQMHLMLQIKQQKIVTDVHQRHIETIEIEKIFLNENLPHQHSPSATWWHNSFWMGLTDVGANGTWVWINNVTEVETMFWFDGQPNYIGDQKGNCVASYQSRETKKTWINGNCKVNLLNWVCEMEPNPGEKISLSDCFHSLLFVKMADEGNSSSFVDTFDKLICEDDSGTDENPLYSSQDKQQVSMSMPRHESSRIPYRLLTVILAMMAVILLAINIGLGVYYNQLTGGKQTIKDIHSEVAKLQAGYSAVIQEKIDAKNQLDRELGGQQQLKWDLEHQTRRSKDYEKQIHRIEDEVSELKSLIPLLSMGCRHCNPGWTFLHLRCYYFSFPVTLKLRPWKDARQFCQNLGGDLAVIDTPEKTVSITTLINSNHDPERSEAWGGFWIGLSDVEEEHIWKWPDGRRLTEPYWNDGEPNNSDNEDCGATYPKNNPFKAWNDASCNSAMKWICEMEPHDMS